MAEIGTSIAAKIAEYLVEPTLRPLRYMCCFHNIVEDLRQENRKLTVAQEQLEIKVKRARGNAEEIRKDVETWLEDTKIFIEEAKSLEIEAKENKNCLNGWCPNLCCRYWFGRKAAKKKLAIKNHQEEIGKFTQVGDPANLLNPGFISSTDFFSSKATESATHQIMEALKDENVNMIGLHGMGGSGKTTLVKDLGGRAKELKLFDMVVIAVVSQTPDVKKIQGQIADSLRLNFNEETESGRASRLWEKLKSEKKILIILDDVWDSLDLKDKIGIPFGDHHKGCKILLTTRRQQLCTTMKCQKTIKLDVLSEDEAWALFKKHTGLDNDDSTLTNVAMEVTRECKGLPLAIVTVGRALRGKTHDEYVVALEQLKSSRFVNVENAEKDVYACLKLSYDYLKSKEIQSCFLLCSLFPEDYEIDIEDLARIGWGKGLFQEAETIEDARMKMRVRMKELQSSGLLIDIDKDQFVKMHDMVRDVALYIAKEGESAFMVRTGAGLKTWPHDRNLERYTTISLMDNNIEELPNGLVCPNLNTLLLEGNGVSMTISDAFFEEMKALKVLSICKGILVPQSLQFLTNLQTLHLDFCESNNISSLGKLKKLGILRLRGSTIVELPNEIGELNDLKLLDLNGCRNLKRIPPIVISKLSKLEELYIEFNIHQWSSISVNLACDWLLELNSLSHLAVLSLEFDAKYLPMGFTFPKLARYKINMLNSFMGYPNSRTLGMKDIDATTLNALKELLPTVKYLDLESAVGFQNIIPNMNQRGLKNLISLHLKSCREMECLIDSTQQQVPTTAFSNVGEGNHVMLLSNLTSLDLDDLPELKCLWKGPTQHISLQSLRDVKVSKCQRLTCLFSSSLARSLLQLQRLEIEGSGGLEQIIIIVKEDGEISSEAHLQPRCFPKLRTLTITKCAKLEYIFPISVARGLQQLEVLIISSAPQLKHVFGHGREEDGNDIMLPQLRILELRILSSLTSFYEGNYHWKWPSLQELTVVKCPKLSTSFIIDLEANLSALQKLRIGNRILLAKAIILLQTQSLQKLEELRIENCEGVQEIFHGISTDRDDELSVSNLKELCLRDVPELRVIWKGSTQISIFQNLTHIWIVDCKKLKHIFSPSVARNLQRLEDLIINGCDELERIIGEDEEDEIISVKPHLQQQPIRFPNLNRISVEDCHKLKSLFPITIARGLPQLEDLWVERASELEEVFRHENEEDLRDENKILLQQLGGLLLGELPRLISFCPGGYHFIFPSLTVLRVIECPNITMSFTIASDGPVHAKAKAKVETPQLVKEDIPEGSSTPQATVATMPSHNNINWRRGSPNILPPYMEESAGNL